MTAEKAAPLLFCLFLKLSTINVCSELAADVCTIPNKSRSLVFCRSCLLLSDIVVGCGQTSVEEKKQEMSRQWLQWLFISLYIIHTDTLVSTSSL